MKFYQQAPFRLDSEASKWVEDTLSSLSTDEKIGQLFATNIPYYTDEFFDYVLQTVKPGGVSFRPESADKLCAFANRFNRRSRVPLLISANLEKGADTIQGGIDIASPLAIAATGDPAFAGALGEVCAVEGRAVGVNWAFAPIIDVERNYRNPVTNVRTFGADPDTVAAMGSMYIRRLQSNGMAACMKHFPGDGCDDRDQHLCTTVNDCDCETWDATYGKAYRAAIDAGVLSCMVGHIMQPAYSKALNPALRDDEILPASLSSELLTGLLRGKLGFNGLIVTDASTMAGFTTAMKRSDAVPGCIAAGCDMFLFPRNLEEDFAYMKRGVKQGRLTERRLDDAVRRVLAMKAALGLHHGVRPVCAEEARQAIANPVHQAWARDCADKAITLVRQEAGVLPLCPNKTPRLLLYPIESEVGKQRHSVADPIGAIHRALEKEGFRVTLFAPDTSLEGKTRKEQDFLAQFDLLLYIANVPNRSNQTTLRIHWQNPMGADCPHYLHSLPTVFVSVENPYHLLDVPNIRTYINTYASDPFTLERLIEKLRGQSPFMGRSPIDPFCGRWSIRRWGEQSPGNP